MTGHMRFYLIKRSTFHFTSKKVISHNTDSFKSKYPRMRNNTYVYSIYSKIAGKVKWFLNVLRLLTCYLAVNGHGYYYSVLLFQKNIICIAKMLNIHSSYLKKKQIEFSTHCNEFISFSCICNEFISFSCIYITQ